MYVQWDSSADDNYMRVGLGHVLGLNIIASIKYDQFNFNANKTLKYVGFARSYGIQNSPVDWRIYTNNLPSYCLTETEQYKMHKSHNYKQTCIQDETGSTDLIIYDLVSPDCIYYTSNTSNTLQYTYTINEPYDYITMNLELFAEFKNVSNVSNCSCSVDGEVFIHYAYDGVHYELLGNSNHVSINLHQVSHLSRIHFNVTNIPTANMGLNCEIYVNGATYKTSNPETYWNIIKVQSGGTDIYQHGESIWNSNNVTKLNSVVFEFSFQNVLGSEYIAINVGDLLTIENKTTVQWDPHLDREKCKTIDYWDGISRNLRVNCHGSSTGTFEHLKDIDTFSISFTPHMVSEYGITDIQLYYGLCYDVLPLIWHSVRYNNNYYPLTDELMHSLTNDYIFMMIQCELDTYESSETFIKLGSIDNSNNAFVVQIKKNTISILDKSNNTVNHKQKKCAYWCDIHKDCKAWMYNATGYCWLKKTSDLNIIKTGGYISGICISEYIYDDNTTCINEHTLIKHGYKTDITDYFINHALINYDQAIINCVTDSMHLINITVSHNNGITFPINVGSQVSKISKNISNLTYASKIKFDVSEVRYNISLDKNGYYGFEAIGHPSYFISQCGNNIYLTNFTRRQNRTISSYQWQIVSPGLNGDDGTISILGSYYIGNEKYETYVTVTDNTQQATDIESTRLTLPPIHRYVFNNNGLKEGEIHIACVADDALVVHYAKDGTTYGASIGDVSFGVPLLLNISDVTAASKLRFSVTNSGGTSNNGAGLRCSIYSHVAVVSTSNNSSFWSVNASRGNDTIVYVWSGLRSIADTVSESNGEFIWNTNCTGLEATTPVACVGTTVVFQFEFTNMKLYHYNMSTFKLVPCTTPGYTQSAFAIEGVGEYSNNYFVINDQIKPTNVAGKCSLYSSPESDILLANTFAPNTFMCWYIRSANPTGLGCTIDINKTIYVTSDDTMYWNVGNIETDSKYLNAELNLTQHGGRWIWNQPCLPINNTECINSNSAEFTFSLNNISTYPTYTDCESQCYEYAECDGWVYRTPNHSRIEPECYLSYDLPIDLIEDQDYTTGFVVIQNQCHCICGDCYPGNEYHYIYLNDSTRFDNPLFMG
eukprot:516349_1